jgi:hypothetical protein
MLAERLLRIHRKHRPPPGSLAARALAPLPKLCQRLAKARLMVAAIGFAEAVEALGHLRFEPLARRLRGARLPAPSIWLEFAAEEKEAARVRLYAERGSPLPPRANGPIPISLGYLLTEDATAASIRAALVIELADPEGGVALSLCPYELVVDVGREASGAARPIPADPPAGAPPSLAARRRAERANEEAALAELDARLAVRPLHFAPRTAAALARRAPDIEPGAWTQDLATEAASIAAAIGLLATPSALAFAPGTGALAHDWVDVASPPTGA